MNRIVCCLFFSVLVWSGCSVSHSDSTLPGPQVRFALEDRLGVVLNEAPPVIDTATLANVAHSYAARTSNEQILVVVFESAAATNQILGEATARDDVAVVRRSNVVVLYSRERGTVSRLADVRSAVDAVPGD